MVSSQNRLEVLIVMGTRPEVIKLAPLIDAMKKAPDRFEIDICVTAQHREMLDQVLEVFGITPDIDLDIMTHAQTPTRVASVILSKIENVLTSKRYDWVIVQGDTTTVAATALAAFYIGVPVAHVEAGLRTGDKQRPFPEEVNRRLAGVLADLHFAPTSHARSNLLLEGVPEHTIVVTGNPVIDALHMAIRRPPPRTFPWSRLDKTRRLILLTAHRRENIGAPLERICRAVLSLSRRYGDQVQWVYPVHRNPNVQSTVYSILGEASQIILTPPVDYLVLVHLLERAYLVLTDSGGLQEEAPSLGKPVLVLREVTERPEAVEAGTVQLVGTHQETIRTAVERLLDDSDAYNAMAHAVNPYGDGKAAQRIADTLAGRRVVPFQPLDVKRAEPVVRKS